MEGWPTPIYNPVPEDLPSPSCEGASHGSSLPVGFNRSFRLLQAPCALGHVSKDWLDIADTAGRAVRIANTVAAMTPVLHRKPWLDPVGRLPLMVCEVTGGYERPLMRVVAQLGLPLRRVHPDRARAFAQAAGATMRD